jgi:hypothetical protein
MLSSLTPWQADQPAVPAVTLAVDGIGRSLCAPPSFMKKLILFLLFNFVFVNGAYAMNEIRTYMPFTYPVDPARIQIIPDMDMAFALATTLVRWNDNKETSAGLAESWKIVGPKKYRFYIKANAKWSNGDPITSSEIKKCFERAEKAYPEDFRSFTNLVSSMETPAPNEIDFNLSIDAHHSRLLKKLAEGNFGVLRIDAHGNVDATVSSGPFYLTKDSNKEELKLLKNPLWVLADPKKNSADKIVVRRSPADSDPQTTLLNDPWPNLIEASSLIDEKTFREYETKKFQIWKRPADKFFYLQIGKRLLNDDGLNLTRYLGGALKKETLVGGLSGYSMADQVHPKGYQLYDTHFEESKKEKTNLPAIFKTRPLEILISPTRVGPKLKENIKNAILAATGIEPRFISIPLQEVTPLKSNYPTGQAPGPWGPSSR